jgi:hypothetical protein
VLATADHALLVTILFAGLDRCVCSPTHCCAPNPLPKALTKAPPKPLLCSLFAHLIRVRAGVLVLIRFLVLAFTLALQLQHWDVYEYGHRHAVMACAQLSLHSTPRSSLITHLGPLKSGTTRSHRPRCHALGVLRASGASSYSTQLM